MAVLELIRNLEGAGSLTKHERIIAGIHSAILEKRIKNGEIMPSVNEMANELGFARETIVKAYNELKERGILSSKRGVGYFIKTMDVDQTLRVALVMYSFHDFQQNFYNTFRESLGENVKVEVFFHHNNPVMYESILQSIQGRFGYYVVAPIHHIDIRPFFESLDPSRLLIVDRYEYFGDEYSFISQEFENNSFRVFRLLKEAFAKYENIILYYDESKDHPEGVKKAFQRFLSECSFQGEIKPHYERCSIQKNTAYITISDHDLWEILKDANDGEIEVGHDIGILSHNHSLVKEYVSGGITTYFVDFDEMAKAAAKYIMEPELVQTIMPIKLIRRNSL